MEDRPGARACLRVLHALNELRPSGAEVMLRGAAAQWKEHGVEADVIAVAPAVGAFATELRAAGYGVSHEAMSPLWRLVIRFRRRVRAGGYDVVHLHDEPVNFWLALAALSTGAAVAGTVHNVFPLRGKARAKRIVQRAVLRALGVVHIAVSGDVAANERRRFGNPARVVENWYDPVFTPPAPEERARARAALGLGDHDLVVVSVGNCSSVKRHEAVLEALAHPAAPPRLVYLHVGQEDAEHSERRLADRLGVADRVRFLGVRHPLEALHAADAYAMPSRHEGMSIAALEALATGLPAVFADVPGLRGMADAGPAVVLADVAPEPLARALTEAAALPPAERGPRAAAVRARFGMARGVAEHVGIYRRLVSPRKSTGPHRSS
ncbi:glycosyltransferase [Streptomyces sp. NPDC001817]|uniref:glycosyltransferase n=1 Tax=Streptomyces sp. NPDC001817 TaxID=3154398 RepID=UPI003326DB75